MILSGEFSIDCKLFYCVLDMAEAQAGFALLLNGCAVYYYN